MYLIGYILKPHGIKGEVKVNPITPYPERFNQLDSVYLKNDTAQTYSIQKVRISNRFVFLKFAEINSRSEAELLRDCEILIEEDKLIQLKADEFFVHDLIGCEVVSESGERIGEIIEVMQVTSNDIYVVQDRRGKEILVPAIKDVVKHIDLEQKQIKIHLMDGMI
jgi:16S rRNA processing protein RimM